LRVQRIESAEFVGGQGNRSRLAAAPVSRLKQLQGDRRSMSGNGDELKQSLGGLDLAVLEAQSLFLKQPKQLFDDPSRPVPIDDLPGGRSTGDSMVVRSRQVMGWLPWGGSGSVNSIKLNVTCAGSSGALVSRGRAIVTTPNRSSNRASRSGRPGRSRRVIRRVPANGNWRAIVVKVPPSTRLRSW
jgi:hypothetical protein